MRIGIAGVLVPGLIAVAAAQLAAQTEQKNWTVASNRAPMACLPVKISLIDDRSNGDPTDGRCREASGTPSVSETRTKTRFCFGTEPDTGGASAALVALVRQRQAKRGFAWRRALLESATLLTLQHLILFQMDRHLVQGSLFHHYFSDYAKSLRVWASTGWGDGDPLLDNYIAHPLQGALTGYIQVQNDPYGYNLKLSRSKAYWKSRLKAAGWAAAYSLQWELGPLSEMTVEKYGRQGEWVNKGRTINGTGQVDLVITPVGGLGWMVLEDFLDANVMRRVEERTSRRVLINVLRCALNPARSAAAILHLKKPWHRTTRENVR